MSLPELTRHAEELPLLHRTREFGITNLGFTMMNHGAFGGALRCAIDAKNRFEEMQETNPYAFQRQLPQLMRDARGAVEELVSADTGSIALIPNVTLGLNAAINSLINEDDKVAYLDVVYGSTFQMLEQRCERVGAEGYAIELIPLLPAHDTLACDIALTQFIEDRILPGTTCVVMDHVTSSTAIELPIFSHILPMLARKGITKTIVDGAHGPFQCELNLSETAAASSGAVLPTVYTGNLHKWLSVPKSVGFIFVSESYRTAIRPPIVGDDAVEFEDAGCSSFVKEFEQTFTNLNSALTIPTVMQFWKSVGMDTVRSYCKKMLTTAQDVLTDGFVSDEFIGRHAPFMCLIPLDRRLRGPHYTAKFLQDVLHFDFGIEVPIKDVDGRLYIRVSAMAYNTRSDYVKLRDALHRFTSRLLRSPRATDSDGKVVAPKRQREGCSGAVAKLVAKKTSRLEVDAL